MAKTRLVHVGATSAQPKRMKAKRVVGAKRRLLRSDRAISLRAGTIFREAYHEAYHAGLEIVVRRGDQLVLVQKGQSVRILKSMPQRISLPVGTVLRLA